MMKILLVLSTTVVLLAGQITIAPHNQEGTVPAASSPRKAVAAVPLLGFTYGSNAADVYEILGTAIKARLGERVALPPDTSRIYLPPRQRYALIERNTGAPMALWNLVRNAPETAISGSMPHVDRVAFSPRGEAAALFSIEQCRLQVIANLPGQAFVSREVSTVSHDPLSALAVTDDGALLVADFTDRAPLFSFAGGPWQFVSTAYRPQAWSFVPRTHDLVISDPAEKAIVLLPKVNETPIAARILASELAPDRMAVTKDGDLLLAASSSDTSIWSVDLALGTTSRRRAGSQVTLLSLLRDGRTFLLSPFPNLLVLQLVPSPDHRLVSLVAH